MPLNLLSVFWFCFFLSWLLICDLVTTTCQIQQQQAHSLLTADADDGCCSKKRQATPSRGNKKKNANAYDDEQTELLCDNQIRI